MASVSVSHVMINDYLRKTIRALTFTYAITWPEVQEILYDCDVKLQKKIYAQGISSEISPEIRVNISKRLYTLFERLNTPQIAPSILSKTKFDHPKIYDSAILENGKKLYNFIAHIRNWPEVESSLSEKFYDELSVIEEDKEYYADIIEKLFPHKNVGERNGVTFLEAVILSIIYSVVHHYKRLEKLNKQPTEKDGKYLHTLQDEIRNKIFTPQYIEDLINTFYHTFDNIVADDILISLKKTYSEVLLEKKYRKRIDIFRAASNKEHFLDFERASTYENMTYEDYEILASEVRLERLYNVILPLSQNILLKSFTYIINFSSSSLTQIGNSVYSAIEKDIDSIRDEFFKQTKQIKEISDEEFQCAKDISWVANVYISYALVCALHSTELPEINSLLKNHTVKKDR